MPYTGQKFDKHYWKDGPLQFAGQLEIKGTAIELSSETWLCRCGQSAHKPFCDRTHELIDFQAE